MTASWATAPVATSPAASPATVGSKARGKELLVPVEMATTGMSRQVCATRLLVPSPPSTMMTPTPASIMSSTATNVSVGVPVRAWSRKCTVGQPSAERREQARASPADTPERSVMEITSVTPARASPVISRVSTLTLSWAVTADPWATSRRTSRPDAGLATTPTVGPLLFMAKPPGSDDATITTSPPVIVVSGMKGCTNGLDIENMGSCSR